LDNIESNYELHSKKSSMSALELKSQIMDRLNSIDDELILAEIYNLIRIESDIETVYKLSEAEKRAITRGLKDIEQGNVVTSEEANSLIKEWLKK